MLKKLEIHGFKSFADKTLLTFPAGMSAVVGPNGSGKSNIVDAIRWVLGEQSAKHIRVGSATDVLFNGMGQKPAGGFASVTFEFDNSKKTFPVDFEDVHIGRKVYRDGSSEYTINKKQARLKDVTHILAAAKLGVKGMGIVNQGAADVFLRARSVERREMLEEMIGLKEFRLKKEEAQRRIKETRDNVSKVIGIIRELEPNVRSLRRQVQKWESRSQKESELREIERDYFSRKIHDLESEFSGETNDLSAAQEAEKRITGLKKKIQERQAVLASFEQTDPASSQEHMRIQERMREIQQRRSDSARVLGTIEGQLQAYASLAKQGNGFEAGACAQKLESVRDALLVLRSDNDLSRMQAAIQDVVRDIEAFLHGEKQTQPESDKERELVAHKQAAIADMDQCARELKKLNEELERLTEKAADQSVALRENVKELETLRVMFQEEETRRERMQFAQERKTLKQDDLKMRMQEAGYDWNVFVQEQKAFIAGAGERAFSVSDAEMKMIRLRRDLALIGEIDPEVVKAHQDASERYDFLTRQKEDLDKALADLDVLDRSLEEKIQTGFAAALKEIDAEFDKFFQIIFDGGKASVHVVRVFGDEEADMPESEFVDEGAKKERKKEETGEIGVDFSVHLPRKKVKSWEMLSGGERSLTAIALLFAIITAAKPPLLVLDEIDAALDETNSRKFAKLLREMTKDVQFIIITHNRSVMESADILYGVTMQDGISKVFSLRFAQAEELAAQDKTSG